MRCFLEKVMITFRSENTIFITESDNDYFLVIITFGPSLKSNGHKMSHYSHITWSLPSKVIITCAITCGVMVIGNHFQSNDYLECEKTGK